MLFRFGERSVIKSGLGKVVAFYSYKGGTGRTMALANVGCALAQDPNPKRSVLLVDWDLEAPGLHRYFRKQVTAAFHGDEDLFDKAPGLIDLFLELRDHLAPNGDLSETDRDFDAVTAFLNDFQLQTYIIKTDIPRLHLLKAGCFDDNYAAKIGSFQWPELYRRSPYLLRAFADRLASDYSFVIIDSRTGLTDTSGICAMLMPEILVAVFTPNRQSLFGVIDLVHEAAGYRANSDDLRPLIVYPLPSRIEASEPALRQSWRFGDDSAGVPGFQGMFEQTFKEIYELPACDLGNYFDDVQIQHLPSYAYGEEIAVLVEETRDRLSLTQSYLRFTARLAKGDAPWATSTSMEEAVVDPILLERQLRRELGWRWFLSYNSSDQLLAERLKAAIERKNPASRVVIAPTHFRAGTFWLPQFAQELSEATGFILLVGEHGVGDWQVLEYYEALDKRGKSRDFPLLVILLEGQTAPSLPFLRLLPWIVTADPASEKSIVQLIDAASGGGAPPNELWRYTAPYCGVSAMSESHADFFFGREREIAAVIGALASAPDKLALLIGNSGVGKSSLAQAGVLAALKRQGWSETARFGGPWPRALSDSRRWCFVKLKPGIEPIRALVEPFLGLWQVDVIDPLRQSRLYEWITSLLDGRCTLPDLLDATERVLKEQGQTEPPAFLIYVAQGEELYVRAEEFQRRRFCELVAEGLSDPRLRVMMTLRADFFGELQNDEPLYRVHQLINVASMREAELREVVSRPAELLGAHFESDGLADIIVRHVSEDSVKDSGALPLLSYLLDDMWQRMIERGDGVLRLPAQSIEPSGALVDRATAFLSSHPGSKDQLRRIFTLILASVREDGEPTRRAALRSEFSDEQWRLVSELADHPNRLLVIVTTGRGETYAEVAHEAIFRRWDKLREWIAAEREFLIWRSNLEVARRAWQVTPESQKYDTLLMGAALAQAQSWYLTRSEDLSHLDREFVELSIKRERKMRMRARRVQALVYMLLIGMIVGWFNQTYIRYQWRWYTKERPFVTTNIWPYVLTEAAERGLKPMDSFRECKDNCPEMIVIPAGSFLMGSPQKDESPQHKVTIAQAFAVSKFELTFDEWDTCAAYGDCEASIGDAGWGRGRRPMIFVTWHGAQQYVAWLSKITGRPYRLLTEAEYEYATRGGTETAFPWGPVIGKNNANCNGCGSEWDNKSTAPVGSFAPNQFGLYDMVGNVFEWTADCFHDSYQGAPVDGSAWTAGDCNNHVIRAGSWGSNPEVLRSADRSPANAAIRNTNLGFRIGRTLAR
jgi:formylglycine-generating enzyme required for sulfatase activity/cellulose biosynthesis protein BcsQ